MNFTTDQQSPNGSWLQGEITTTYANLVSIFGEPNSDGDGYKVQAEWDIRFEDGTYATIYDWKEGSSYNGPGQGIPPEMVTNWHIGGTERAAYYRVSDLINNVIEMEKPTLKIEL